MKIFDDPRSLEWNQEFLSSTQFRNFAEYVREYFANFNGDIRHLEYAMNSEISMTCACAAMEARHDTRTNSQ